MSQFPTHFLPSIQVRQQYRDFYHRDRAGERDIVDLDDQFPQRFQHLDVCSYFATSFYFVPSLYFGPILTHFNVAATPWKMPLLGCLSCTVLRRRKKLMRKIQSERCWCWFWYTTNIWRQRNKEMTEKNYEIKVENMKNYGVTFIKIPLINQVPNLPWSHRLDEHCGHRNKVFSTFSISTPFPFQHQFHCNTIAFQH